MLTKKVERLSMCLRRAGHSPNLFVVIQSFFNGIKATLGA